MMGTVDIANDAAVKKLIEYAKANAIIAGVDNIEFIHSDALDAMKKIKKAVNIPVFGSLNGVSTGGWIDYARKIQDAGADAIFPEALETVDEFERFAFTNPMIE